MSAPRVVLLGDMGMGKTTAIRTLCGAMAVDCEVENLDRTAYDKATTTVGADFGVVELDNGHQLHIYGSPGQERFSFMRDWLLSVAIGVVILVDVNDPAAAEKTLHYIEMAKTNAASPQVPMVITIVRAAKDEAIYNFINELQPKLSNPLPIIPVDVRNKDEMLNILDLMFSMIETEMN